MSIQWLTTRSRLLPLLLLLAAALTPRRLRRR